VLQSRPAFGVGVAARYLRDMAKAKQTLHEMPDVVLETKDLLDPASIDKFADRVLTATDTLHLLVNSAGVIVPPLMRDTRGYEFQFSANHPGHFQLTCRLWRALVRANSARVIALSSLGHRRGGVDFHGPNFERREYDPWSPTASQKQLTHCSQ
jgi:NAD(P)-dependent dehydrogenase (short-subunit alcohol dehydrogenase family)